jgi:hypothetical protein
MIEARLQKARRLHRIHKSIQRLEEERIAGLRRRQAELAMQQEETVNSLSADGDLQGIFMPMIVRRLKALREEAGRIDAEIERRLRALQGIAARTKYAERLSDNYDEQRERALEQKELRDVIERATRAKDASLP